MNKEIKLACFIIVAFTFIPGGYMFYKQIAWFEMLQNPSLAEAYDSRADEIEAGNYEYSSSELISHFRVLAESNRLIDTGLQKFIVSLKIWFGVIVFCALVNAYFLRQIYVSLRKNA